MILIWSILVGVAAFRAWRILATDSITEPIRHWAFQRTSRVWRWIVDLFMCPWCIGFWYSAAGSGLLLYVGVIRPWEFLLVWLVASAVCGLIAKFDEGEMG